MPDELRVADIQQSFFEYRANFREPIIAFWFERRQGEIARALHKAFAPWNVGLENITWNQAAKNAAEIQLTFGVPSLFASFQVGIGSVTLTAFNPDWSRALALFQTGVDALRTGIQEDFQSQLVTLGFHVKPLETTPFKQIMAKFVNVKALGGDDASMYGVSVYSNDYSYVIDASGIIPGGVFIKLIRNFTAEKRFDEMAATMYKDEEFVLYRLGLKLQ